MKVEFNTSKGKFAFVNLCIGKPKVKHLTEEFLYVSVFDYLLLELGQKKDFKLIGFVENLTEEQWSEVVDSRYYHSNRTGISNDLHYENYNDKTGYSDFKMAVDSGKSLIDSLKVYIENPYWIDSSYKNCNESCLETVCSCDLIEKWENAEERTGNWLLIKYL